MWCEIIRNRKFIHSLVDVVRRAQVVSDLVFSNLRSEKKGSRFETGC